MTEQQMLRSDATDSSQPEELWRNEIQARVARYRTRRGRRIEGTYSMRFPFGTTEEEATPAASVALEAAAEPLDEIALNTVVEAPLAADPTLLAAEPAVALAVQAEDGREEKEEIAAAACTLPAMEEREPASTIRVESSGSSDAFLLEPDPEPLPPPLPRPPVKRKVIAFPRQATTLEEGHRLADPVLVEQPRILDVPEELEPFPTTPLLEGLQLPASPSSMPSPDHVDLPLAPATLSRRVVAGLIDCGVVLGSCVVFGGVAYKFLPKLQPSKTLILGAALVPILLWAVYEYLLLMYAGRTVGMQVTRTRLSTFKGGAPGWRYRRSRVISLYFSAASLMMGVLWSLVDVDALGWHDRISHTYLTKVD